MKKTLGFLIAFIFLFAYMVGCSKKEPEPISFQYNEYIVYEDLTGFISTYNPKLDETYKIEKTKDGYYLITIYNSNGLNHYILTPSYDFAKRGNNQ